MLDPDRPIYPSAPLKLVTFQLRFPPIPELDEITPPRDLANALRQLYPILGGPPPFMQVEMVPGQASITRGRGSRFMNRNRTKSVVLASDSITVETSAYERYERFAEDFEWTLAQVHTVTPLPAVTRLGLRYIDEIEIDGVSTLSEWQEWINPDLLAGGLVGGYDTLEYVGQVVLAVDDTSRMVVRYGHMSQPVVEPSGVLRIARSPTSPYFLLDIDSFWEPSQDEFLEFDEDEVRRVCLHLHQPIRDLFERAITEPLRAKFREGTK